MYYVYILECADSTLYTGSTNDLDKRLRAHNLGKGAKYTRGRRPVKMVYWETCRDKSSALKREAAIKKYAKCKKLELIRSQNGSSNKGRQEKAGLQ